MCSTNCVEQRCWVSAGSGCLLKCLVSVRRSGHSKVIIHTMCCNNHFDSRHSLYLSAPHIFPHSTGLLCTLASVLSGQRRLQRLTDVDISPLHHHSLLETGGRKERTTKGAGINHPAFVIIIQNDGG